jgi:hypothetical protein
VADAEFVLFYETDEATRLERLTGRSATSGRVDDNVETIRKRFRVFEDETMPVVNSFAALNRVRVISGAADPDRVFVDTRAACEPVVQSQVLEANRRLLAAVDAGDERAYAALCHADLSAVEPESNGLRVTGIDFHRTFLRAAAALPAADRARTYVQDPVVRLLGPGAALVTYTRVVPSLHGPARSFSETRVWEDHATRGWINTHFHRSPIGSASESLHRETLALINDVAHETDAAIRALNHKE